mgnify:CR=1 FL=1
MFLRNWEPVRLSTPQFSFSETCLIISFFIGTAQLMKHMCVCHLKIVYNNLLLKHVEWKGWTFSWNWFRMKKPFIKWASVLQGRVQVRVSFSNSRSRWSTRFNCFGPSFEVTQSTQSFWDIVTFSKELSRIPSDLTTTFVQTLFSSQDHFSSYCSLRSPEKCVLC